ncbi:radical SAM protein [Terrisporobacter sp.]
MESIHAKTILYKHTHTDSWFGLDYGINIYRGCSHGCIYCDSRGDCYQISDFDTVKVKENALEILQKELQSKRKKGVVGVGAMSDTYNHFEKKYEFTRNALKLINKYDFGLSIDTKSKMVLRDLDLIKEINEKNPVIIKLSITTTDENLAKIIEPHASTPNERFETIKALSDANIFTGILLMPVLPFLTDNEKNIKDIVKRAHESGAKFIYTYMGTTLRNGCYQYYHQKLRENFPGLSEKYYSVYKYDKECLSSKARELFEVFKSECDKYNILYKMEDIIKAYKNRPNKFEQLSLF